MPAAGGLSINVYTSVKKIVCVCLQGRRVIIGLNTKPFCQFNDSPDSFALSQRNIKPLPPINVLHLLNKQWTEPVRTHGQRISAMHTESCL